MLSLALLLFCASPDEPTTAASWIWYPERPAVEGAGQTRYFRRVVRLDAAPKRARLRWLADDGGALWVNGRPAPKPVEHGLGGTVYDLTEVLVAGDNVLACRVHNSGGPGGLILNATIETVAGRTVRVFTDGDWRAAKTAPDGWQRAGFDDRAWLPARLVGSVFAQPWYDHPSFDMKPFLEPDDLTRHDAWMAELTRVPASLATEAPARAELGYDGGHCVLRIAGRPRPPLLYRGTVDPLTAHGRRQIARFRDAGVHVYTAYLHLAPFERVPGQYDFARLDATVRGYLSVDPAAYVVLILHLLPSEAWMDAHPEDLVGYAAGPVQRGADECDRVRRPSYASAAWREDMGRLWTAAIEHLERQPWGKRVIGYHPGYGIYTEWHYYGSWSQQSPDTGPAMTRWFRQWLQQRYGGQVARLQAAWQDPTVTFATAAVPGVPPRLAADALGLRDPARRAAVIDYYRCQQELTAQRVGEFCALARRASGGRTVTGAFYGYFEGVHPQTQGGHLELSEAMRSPAIDYFAAPYDYSHRLMGDDGRSRAIIDTFPLAGKVHMIEADTRTHLHPIEEYGRVADTASSVAAIRREMATALTHHSALWWCDFGADGSGGWYDDDELIGEVRQLVALSERRRARPTRSVAEVALVADLPSCYHLGDSAAMRTHYAMVDQVTGALNRSGAPCDFILLPQLATADLSRYKVLVFLNALRADAAARSAVKRAVSGRAAIWLWAPGITDGQRFGAAQVADLTGFQVGLPADGVTAEEAEVVGDDRLTAGLPARSAHRITARERQPIAAAAQAAAWYNPRDAATMKKSYTAFEVTAAGPGIDWRVGTTDGWSDVHLRAEVAAAEGLGLTVSGTDAVVGTSVRLVLKDADSAEFVAPLVPVTAAAAVHQWPLAAFERAPWYRGPAQRPRLPLSGFKVVLYGVNGGRIGTLRLRDLVALRGEVQTTTRRVYPGPGGAQPCLVVSDPAATVLGRRAAGEPLLAVKGERGRRQLYSALASLPLPVLTAMMDEAGVHRFVTTPEVLVQADATLLMLHSATGGPVQVRLPAAERLTDALTGETVGRGREVEVMVPTPGTRLLERWPQ